MCDRRGRPRSNEAIVNLCLGPQATNLTKLDKIGVKIWVIEVEKLKFYIHFKKYSWEILIEKTTLCQQVLPTFKKNFRSRKLEKSDIIGKNINKNEAN